MKNRWMALVSEDVISALIDRLAGLTRTFTVESFNRGGVGEYRVYVEMKDENEFSPTNVLGTKWGIVPIDELADLRRLYIDRCDEVARLDRALNEANIQVAYKDGCLRSTWKDHDRIAALNKELVEALEQIATADHPEYPHFEGHTEYDFGVHLMDVARTALAKARQS